MCMYPPPRPLQFCLTIEKRKIMQDTFFFFFDSTKLKFGAGRNVQDDIRKVLCFVVVLPDMECGKDPSFL